MNQLAPRTYRCDRCGHTASVPPRELAEGVVAFDAPYCVASPACERNPLNMARTPRDPTILAHYLEQRLG